MKTTVERTSERELVITRTINGPARIVFEAWTKPELFQRWWLPKSAGITIVSYEAEFRAGGTYRLVLRHPSAPEPMAFFGTYVEVTPNSRLVWTNEEEGDKHLTTVTFEETAGKTTVVVRELYPSKEALDEARSAGAAGWTEQLDQLEELLAS